MNLRFVSLVYCAFLAALPAARANDLQCSGTEPFWGLALGAAAITYDDAEGIKISLDAVVPRHAAGTSPDYLSIYETKVTGGTDAYTIVIKKDDEDNCSDGMSDTNYPYSIVFIGKARVLHGCCLSK